MTLTDSRLTRTSVATGTGGRTSSSATVTDNSVA